MYLKYLQIVNYKNLKTARFQFDKGANTIIGENDSGKSNAMTAIRILLDDSFYYTTKRLKESDFADSLGDWRGHWIIISAFFDEITPEEKTNEPCQAIIPEKDKENANFLRSYIRCEDKDFGVVTLFIRPRKHIRAKLATAESKEEFERIRSKIKLDDYEFKYTARAQTDFTDPKEYIRIVGDLESGSYVNPDDDDDIVLGGKLEIMEIWKYISVVYIDALRDVESELRKPKNPIRRIVDNIQSQIDEHDIESIKQKIRDLNNTISAVDQIEGIGDKINSKLNEMIGLVYTPDITLESQLKDDMNSLARHLTMLPANQNDLDLLGLGHLNMIYIALKLVEFELNRNQELINIMIIEEPEAHIHTHIQKTLFENLKVAENYSQVLMTTHSTYLSEVSDIKKMNILKSSKNVTTVMHPSTELELFGREVLKLKVPIVNTLERYLDAKRSVLLFSKGIILVEGDGEEILIPHLVKAVFGVSLDELGIGLVNVGSVAFENIACIFDNARLQRYCSIITDEDIQIKDSKYFSERAEKLGKSRIAKLNKLFKSNNYVNAFYAKHTFEVDFANEDKNVNYIKKVINILYSDKTIAKKHKENLEGSDLERYDTILTIANQKGKGWYATLLAGELDAAAIIPNYIIKALAFASQDVLNQPIMMKMIRYSLNAYSVSSNIKALKKQLKAASTDNDKYKFISHYCKKLPKDMITKLIKAAKEYEA